MHTLGFACITYEAQTRPNVPLLRFRYTFDTDTQRKREQHHVEH